MTLSCEELRGEIWLGKKYFSDGDAFIQTRSRGSFNLGITRYYNI